MDDFSIVPCFNQQPLVPEEITVVIPPKFEKDVLALVAEVQKHNQITSPAEEELVKGDLGRVNAVLAQIEACRVVAQAPITALKNAIQEAAALHSGPLEREQERLSKLLIARAAAAEAKREAIIREAYAEKERMVAQANAEIVKLQEEQQKLLNEAKNTEYLDEATRLRRERESLNEKIGEAQWNLEVRRETVVIEPEFTDPLIKGARTPEQIDMEIVDKKLLFQAISADTLSESPIGLWKAVAIELRKQFIKDLIKDMREQNKGNPNWNPVKEFELIGIELKIYRKPYIPQSSRILRAP